MLNLKWDSSQKLLEWKDPNSLFLPRQLLRLTVAYRVPYTIHTLDLASFSGLCHLHIWSLQACKYGRKRPRRFWHLPLSDKRRVEPWEMAPTTIMTFKHMLISSKYIDNNNPHWCCLQTSQPYGYSWQRKCLKILCEAPAPVCLDLILQPISTHDKISQVLSCILETTKTLEGSKHLGMRPYIFDLALFPGLQSQLRWGKA